jgi:hypothetical protein
VPLIQGIIDTANVPRLTSLVRSDTVPSTLSNPYAGAGSLSAVAAGVPAYGLKWSLQSAPANAGRQVRTVTEFEIKFLSLAVHYLLADASDFIGDTVLTGVSEGWLLFETGQPASVTYDITAGWTVNFAWLITP